MTLKDIFVSGLAQKEDNREKLFELYKIFSVVFYIQVGGHLFSPGWYTVLTLELN